MSTSEPRVAVLHTSLLFVEGDRLLRDLFAEILPEAHVIDFIDGDLLATVRRENHVSPASVRRFWHLAAAAQDAGADVAFSVCSSLGPAVDLVRGMVAMPIVKIDDAMARDAVCRAGRIGVLATVSTTLAPTVELLRSAADTAGCQAIVVSRLADEAFARLLAGDRDGHDEAIVDAAHALASDVDLIVLAQASMARLVDRIEAATRMPVLASPRSGVAEVRRVLDARFTAAGLGSLGSLGSHR